MLSCRATLTLPSAVKTLRRYQTSYSASGERHGTGLTFIEHLESAAGQAELQALQERVEARLQEELRLLPPKHSPGVPSASSLGFGIVRTALF